MNTYLGGEAIDTILDKSIYSESAEKMKAILQDNVNKRLTKDSLIHKRTLELVQQDGRLLRDFVIPLGNNSHGFQTNGKAIFRLFTNRGDVGEDVKDFTLHSNAITQIAERYKIPSRYLREKFLSRDSWQRVIAVNILNAHINNEVSKRLLFRTVTSEVRGIVSSSYKRLNSDAIYNRFLKGANDLGLRVYRVGYDETRSWIEAIFPSIMSFPTPKNGIQHVCFGCRVSTSDFGDGALELSFFMLKAWCLNGAVSSSQLRKIHSGREIPLDIKLSNETLKYETEFHAGLVYDSMMNVLSTSAIKNKIDTIKKASYTEIDFVKTLEKLPKMGMNKTEVEELTNVFTGGRLEDGVEGENTTFKLSQAISAVARNKNDRRKRELEAFAGGMIL